MPSTLASSRLRGKSSILLVSLRFKPAFVSLLSALGKAFDEIGFEVKFLLDTPYIHFSEFSYANIERYSKQPPTGVHAYAVFFNVSMDNLHLARVLREAGTKIIYIYHEPWLPSLSFFFTEGLRGSLVAALAHRASVRMLKHSDLVILPSEYGVHTYSNGDSRYNQNAYHIPLLFDDEAFDLSMTSVGDRKYFSYIGNICKAHAFDHFLVFMREAFLSGCDFEFAIASSAALPPSVLSDPIIYRNSHRVRIRCGRPLSNPEINSYFRESFCIWNIYRRSTQSAVLAKAFMFGVPVIANSTGSFREFVQDGYNGRIAASEDFLSILRALRDVRENLDQYTINCRETFLQRFFYRSHLSSLQQLCERLA